MLKFILENFDYVNEHVYQFLKELLSFDSKFVSYK